MEEPFRQAVDGRGAKYPDYACTAIADAGSSLHAASRLHHTPSSCGSYNMPVKTSVVVMAGLPGTGKSTLAKLLSVELHGVVLDKDVIRAGLFPESRIEYSREQDDFCFEVLLETAAYLLRKDDPPDFLFLDGRTFAFHYQMDRVLEWASTLGCPAKIIHTTCSDHSAQQRLAAPHPAKNRDFDAYLKLKAAFEQIDHPKLLVNTDEPITFSLQKCLGYLRGNTRSP
jgi:predicted kinase